MVCYIVGAGTWYGEAFVPQKDDFVIAADGGYRHLKERGIRTDLLIGDFDSMARPALENVQTYHREKDDTDLFLAVKEGFLRGYRTFVLYGATGGDRFEHTVGNLQVLVWLARRGAKALLLDRGLAMTALHNGSLSFDPKASGYLSVFSMSDKADGVTLRGLKYPLENGTLTNDYPLGISNEFIGTSAAVSVENGTLLLATAPSNMEGVLC